MIELRTERVPILQIENNAGIITYLNCYTCIAGRTVEDVTEEDKPYQVLYIGRKRKPLRGIKIMWDDAENMAAIIVCELYVKNPYNGEKRRWEEKKRFYVDRNKNVFQCINGKVDKSMLYKRSMSDICQLTNTFEAIIIDAPGILKDERGNTAWDAKEQFKVFKNLFPHIVPLSGNNMVAIEDMDSLDRFLKYDEPSVKTGPKQKRLEYLISISEQSIPIFSLSGYELKKSYDCYRNRSNVAGYDNVYKIATIQKVPCDEPMCVIRTFAATDDGHGNIDEIREGGRIYVGKKEIIASRTLLDGTFIVQPLLNKPIHWNFNIEWDGNSETVKGTMLEYYSSVMDIIPDKLRGMAIWCFIKYPIVEQLFKAEETRPFMPAFLRLAEKQTPEVTLNCMFGIIHEEEKSLYKKVGMNRYQLQQLSSLMAENMPYVCIDRNLCDGAIGIFKNMAFRMPITMFCIFNRVIDVSHLDNNSTDKLVVLTKKNH